MASPARCVAGFLRLLAFGVRSCGARRQPSCCPCFAGGHGRGQLHFRSLLGDTLACGAGSDVASVAAVWVQWVGGRFAAKRGDDHGVWRDPGGWHGCRRCSPDESQLHRLLLRVRGQVVSAGSRRLVRLVDLGGVQRPGVIPCKLNPTGTVLAMSVVLGRVGIRDRSESLLGEEPLRGWPVVDSRRSMRPR